MSKQEEAELILKLYDFRREEVMRKARSWVTTDFNPESFEDFEKTLFGENSAYFRMVFSYWEMACSLVGNGAIDAQMFNDANGEHIFCFAKIQPFLSQFREAFKNPTSFQHLEKVVMSTPDIETRLEVVRGNIKRIAQRRAMAADQSLRV